MINAGVMGRVFIFLSLCLLFMIGGGQGQAELTPAEKTAVLIAADAAAAPEVPHTIGVYRNSIWALDKNGNGAWDGSTADIFFSFGLPDDVSVIGDWNGSSRTKAGVFRNGTWYLDFDGSRTWNPSLDKIIKFGLSTDIPVTGDWNGSSRTKAGVFRNGTWYLDYNGNGKWDGCGSTVSTDRCFYFGLPADKPVVGDWNGDGKTEIGVFRNGTWYVDYNGNGSWGGCGTLSATDRCYAFGLATDIPVVGDWDGDGTSNIGAKRGDDWYLDYNGNGSWGGCGTVSATDRCYTFGVPTDKPLTGNW